MHISDKIYLKSIGAYAAAIILCIVMLIWVYKLWLADFYVPFQYSGDAMVMSVWIKGILDNGWYLQNDLIGAPFGHLMYDFPTTNTLDFLLIKIISVFTHDYALAINSYFLMTFPLTTLTSMLVFRHFRASYATSILGSLLFAFIPYHFLRGEAHLFLAAYYMIPPMIMVILWVFADKYLLFCSNEENRYNIYHLINAKIIISILICLLISSTVIYYPFFSCFFLLIAGVSSSISQQKKHPLLNSLLLVSIIVAGVLANASPSLIYMHENGKNPEVAIRSPMESEVYGLKIAQIIMPIVGHRIPLLEKISGQYRSTAPLINENGIASLGFIGSIGFLILIALAFYKLSGGLRFKERCIPNHLNELSILNLSAILLATIGGFGTIFAYLLFPEIRCYNRISIFIAFFSLFAIVLLLDKLSHRYEMSKKIQLFFVMIITITLLVGIFDQTSASYVPSYNLTKAEYLNDKVFINNISMILPENAMIFQLPYAPFPEYGRIYNMDDYSHFRAYLHSERLRWSYGMMKGRPDSDWQRLIASMSPEDMIKILSQYGFSGVYIDSYGYVEGGAQLMANISQILETAPIVSENGRLYFFDMTRYNQKNKTDNSKRIIFNVGPTSWHGQEDWAGVPTRWMQADAEIIVFSPENRTSSLCLRAASFSRNRTLEVSTNGALVAHVAVPTNFINVSVPISLDKGANTVRLHVPEGCERPSDIMVLNNPDSRCLSVAVQNLTVT